MWFSPLRPGAHYRGGRGAWTQEPSAIPPTVPNVYAADLFHTPPAALSFPSANAILGIRIPTRSPGRYDVFHRSVSGP